MNIKVKLIIRAVISVPIMFYVIVISGIPYYFKIMIPLIILGVNIYYFIKFKRTIITNPKPDEVKEPIELLRDLKHWNIQNHKPSTFFNKNKDYIQVVLLSKITGQKQFWAEYDGIGIIRTENRAYHVPKENLYGDVFLWDVDKKKAITELINVEKEDAEDSFHELQVFNMAYSVGRQAGMLEADRSKMILVLVIILVVAIIASTAFNYFQFKAINENLGTAIEIASNYIKVHPTP